MSRLTVSCIMVTTAARAAMQQEAIAFFHAQTYPDKELVIEDSDQLIGWKRNRAVQRAKGQIIAHWDDDDWSHPDRLRLQVEALLEADRAMVCGLSTMPFYDTRTKRAVMYEGGDQYLIGTSLVYYAEAAHRVPFLNRQVGEDNHWLTHFEGPLRVALRPERPLMVARWHDNSTVDKYGMFHDPRGRYREVSLKHEVPLCPFD